MSVPRLRFPEFADEWIDQRIGDFADVKTGDKDTQNREDGGAYPFFVRSDTIERINSFAYDGEAVLTSGDGVGVGKNIHYINGRFDYHQRVYAIRDFSESVDGQFFYQFFKSNFLARVMRLSAKNSVDSVRMSMITDMEMATPSLPEQKKIAAFLGAVDAKIAALRAKVSGLETYKRGLMQALFSQRIRFTKHDGTAFPDWAEKCLKDIARIYDGTHQTPSYVENGVQFFSVEQVTANNFNQTKFISESVFEQEAKRVRLERGDILMTRIGDIGTTRLIDWDVRASFYVSLALLKCVKSVNPAFLNQYMKTTAFQTELWKRTIHVAFPKKINLGEIGNCIVMLPHPDEQSKIAEALSAMDAKIQAVTAQVALMETFKKGLLQQMFV